MTKENRRSFFTFLDESFNHLKISFASQSNVSLLLNLFNSITKYIKKKNIKIIASSFQVKSAEKRPRDSRGRKSLREQVRLFRFTVIKRVVSRQPGHQFPGQFEVGR